MRKYWIVIAGAFVLAGCGFGLLAPHTQRHVGGSDDVSSDAAARKTPVPLEQIDHSTWDGLLKKYVDKDGLVNYAAWKKSAADRAALEQYLESLGDGDTGARNSPQAKLAFWINAYNALTVYGILKEYPTTSIRNHTAVAFGYNIWRDLLLRVGSRDYSLETIENEILRKQGEPRIHFAIVCASIGCPRLRNEAYTPGKLESQLADNTRDFFSRSRNLQADPSRRKVRVSSILKWFREDFGPTPQEALAGLTDYIRNAAARRIIEEGDFTVEYLVYDWSLNEQ